MIKKSPVLAKRVRCLVNGLFYDKTESFFKALASDSNSLDGLNAYLMLCMTQCLQENNLCFWKRQQWEQSEKVYLIMNTNMLPQ